MDARDVHLHVHLIVQDVQDALQHVQPAALDALDAAADVVAAV